MIGIALPQYLVLITGGGNVAIYRGTATGKIIYPRFYPAGKRCPAIAFIRSNGNLGWGWKPGSGDENVCRNIYPGLVTGSWEKDSNGRNTNKVTGYTFDISPDGTLTIIYKNEIVMSFR